MEKAYQENSKKEKSAPGGVYINGKQRILKMFQLLSLPEREILIRNIRPKNPALAHELMEESFSFDKLFEVSEISVKKVFNSIDPKVSGMAIKGTPQSFQKKVLRALDREDAELAYQVLNTPFRAEKENVERARKKVLSAYVSFSRQDSTQ